MTIDTSKIKPGDMVHVALLVGAMDCTNNPEQTIFYARGAKFYPVDIVKHIPAPREFKAGDLVHHSAFTRNETFLIIHMDGDHAWIARDGRHSVARLGNLTHAD